MSINSIVPDHDMNSMIRELEKIFCQEPVITGTNGIAPSHKAMTTWRTLGPINVREMIVAE